MPLLRRTGVVEAHQVTFENGPELARWCGGSWCSLYGRGDRGEDISHIAMPTLEDRYRRAELGHWIIRSESGQWEVCSTEQLEREYAPVEVGP